MKKIKLYTLLLMLGLGYLSQARAQEQLKHCGTTAAMQDLVKKHPELAQEIEQKEQEQKRRYIAQQMNGGAKSNVHYVIPVVFHIIHNYGAENISDTQIMDQMRILNEDYAKLNSDTSDVINEFKSVIGNADIEFRLARIDPWGNCTNGIDRIASYKTYNADDDSKLNPWKRQRYLNIWVVNSIGSQGVAGYAYKPSGVDNVNGYLIDGIIILHDYIGSIGTSNVNKSRALTHEIGHYLGLDHTWGGTNNPEVACGDDGIMDTPVTEGHLSCPLNSAVCYPPIIENVQNYMEYSYCSNMFTIGQCDYMRITLQNSVSARDNLSQQANLVLTGTDIFPNNSVCAPKASFKADKFTTCIGDNVQFTSFALNGPVSTYSWTFSNANPASSSVANPVVSFYSSGWQTVTLTVSNSSGSDTKTINNYIYVHNQAPYASVPYSEPFDQYSDMAQNWHEYNYDGDNISWTYNSQAGENGNGCMFLSTYGQESGLMDEIVSPPYNLSYLSGGKLIYSYACGTTAVLPADMTDVLKIYSSVDCGETWTMRKTITGAVLASANSAGSFVPAQFGWEHDTLALTPSLNAPFVQFKFQYISGKHPNNLYIDNIQISGTVGLIDGNENQDIVVYPNPADDITYINLQLQTSENISLNLFDLNGKKCSTLFSGLMNKQQSNIMVDLGSYTKGIYFLQLQTSDKITYKKLVIE